MTHFEDASDSPEQEAGDTELAVEPERAVEPEDLTAAAEVQGTGAVAEMPLTGDATVDAVLSSLADLDERPVDDHPAVYAQAHDTLREALSGRAADVGER